MAYYVYYWCPSVGQWREDTAQSWGYDDAMTAMMAAQAISRNKRTPTIVTDAYGVQIAAYGA